MPAPPLTALEGIAKISPQLFKEVRDGFLAEAKANPQLYYKEDIECCAANEWQIQRFILEHKSNAEAALKALTTAMQWRKSFGVKELNDQSFPEEFYASGAMVIYGRDRKDAKIMIVRANIHKKIADWTEYTKKFFVYQIEQIDFDNDGKGVTLILDCTGIGISNLDLDLLQFIVNTFSSYYPKLFDGILVHELPFLLQYVFKLVQSWLPEDDRKFFHLTSKKNLHQFVATEQLPKFMNGTNPQSYQLVPKDVLNCEEFAKRVSIKPKEAEKLKFLHNYY